MMVKVMLLHFVHFFAPWKNNLVEIEVMQHLALRFFLFSYVDIESWWQVVLPYVIPLEPLQETHEVSAYLISCLYSGKWQWTAVTSCKRPRGLRIPRAVVKKLLRGNFSVAYDEWVKSALGRESMSSPYIRLLHIYVFNTKPIVYHLEGTINMCWMNKWYKVNCPKLSGVSFLPNLCTSSNPSSGINSLLHILNLFHKLESTFLVS